MMSPMKQAIPLRDRMEMLIPPLPWDRPKQPDGTGPLVLLLHGLWRGWHAMEPMARALRQAGFSTLNLPYPSTRRSIPELIDQIARILEPLTKDQPIHAVTHSLGGILAHAALAESKWNIDRLVMLAPPSKGSEIVDHLATQHPLILRCLGPAGRALGTQGLPSQLPDLPSHVAAATIMGNLDSIGCFNRLFHDEHDGIVSVAGGQLQNLKGFKIVAADHTFIAAHPQTQRLTVEFLQTGAWSD